MNARLNARARVLRSTASRWLAKVPTPTALSMPVRTGMYAVTIVGALAWLSYYAAPIRTVGVGEVGIRTNVLTAQATQWTDGSAWVVPGLHRWRTFSLRDQSYRAEALRSADGPQPLQSLEGLSFGADFVLRYSLDPAKLNTSAARLPDDVAQNVIEPAVQGIIYKVFARYTLREAFSTKRDEIQAQIKAELGPRLAEEGLLLRAVQIGKVDLPEKYRQGMEQLLSEELETQKIRYTLDLKEKRVKELELEATAEKRQREIKAEAAAREQVIAAKAQEEAMKHVLPFKQRQIEQRQFEAEAEKQARIRAAEGAAQARRIEATGEAEARQKLAEAEAWRLDRVGKVQAEQMEREGVAVSKHPLLVQKALADKLSDKVQVIIAPPPTGGGFVAEGLLGATRPPLGNGANASVAKTAQAGELSHKEQ